MPDGLNLHPPLLNSASAFVSSDHGDVRLIALGKQFEQAYTAERQAWSATNGLPDAHPLAREADALNDVTSAIVHLIAECPVTTMAGVMVKMRAVHWSRTGEEIEAACWTGPSGSFVSLDVQLMTSALNAMLVIGAAR